MAEPALIQALRQEATEEIEALWRAARAEVVACEATHARALEAQRVALERAREVFAAGLERTTIAGAERTARTTRAAATAELAGRLRGQAAASLSRLRGAAGRDVFAALAAELPACAWERVRVNPADAALARRHFPGVAVVSDSAVSGGMDVETDAGRVRVSNTFETRLDAAWPDLLPVMVKHVVADLERD